MDIIILMIISRMMNDDKRIEFDMPGTSGKEEPKEEVVPEKPKKKSTTKKNTAKKSTSTKKKKASENVDEVKE